MAAPGGVGLMAARSVPVQPGRAARPGVSARPVALAMTTEGEGAESIDGPSVAQPNRLRLDLQRARSALIEAELAVRPADRFLGAQLGALRVAAVVLSARSVRRPVGSGPRNVWELVADVAPEYTEWAAFFAVRSGIPPGPAVALDSDLSSTLQADKLFRIDGPSPAVLHLELEATGRLGVPAE